MAEITAIPRKTNRLDLLLAIACGVVAFLVYLLTLSPGVYPGQSAQLMAVCTGVEPAVAPAHPLWTPIVAWLGNLDVLTLPVRLNLFSALCGALAVSLLYRLAAFLVRQTIYDDTVSDRHRNIAAVLAGLAAAVAFAFCVPFWSASTRLQYQSFDLLLLLAVFYLLVLYVRTGWLFLVLVFAFCYGVGMVESILFLAMAPVAGLAALFVLWQQKRLDHGTTIAMSLLLLLGLGVYVVCARHFFATEDVALRGYKSWQDVLVYMWRDQYHELQNGLPRLNWFWLLLQSVAPALAAGIAARRALNNERSWSLYLLHVILAVIVVFVLTNVPWSPWRLVEGRGILPVVSYALMALVGGYLVAYCFLLAVVDRTRHDQQVKGLTKSIGKWMGVVLVCVLLFFVVAAAVVNAFEADGHRGRGADACAQELLQRMGNRTWIVTDGLLDNHIGILARVRGQKVHLLCLQRDTDKVYQRRLARVVEREKMFGNNQARMLNTLDLGILPFLQDWLANDPEVSSQLVIFSVPDLWYGAGALPIPDLLFFTGARDTAKLDAAALVADHLAFWSRMEKIVPRATHPYDPISAFNNQLRRQMGFLGNNLGVVMEEIGKTNEADAVYQRVRQLDPDNVSVLINRFELARRLKDEARCAAAEKELKDFLAHDKRTYPLYSLSRYYGYIRDPALFAKLGWAWALSGQMGAGLVGMHKAVDLLPPASQIALEHSMAAIYLLQDDRVKSEDIYRNILEQHPDDRQAMRSMARLAVAEGALEKAKSWLDRIQKTGVAQNQLGVEWAAIHLAAGETALASTNLSAATASFAQARMQLQETVDLEPNNLQAWGMLAVVQLQQAGVERVARRDALPFFKEVEQTIEKMDKIAGSPDQYFIQIVKAQLAMARGKEDYRIAREAFIRASILRPDVVKLNDVILQLDIALADQPMAERHARAVLRINRRHALANYVIGSLRLQAGEYGEAEDFLRRSVEAEPLPVALNDLAETLRRLRRFGEAEKLAREATVKSPNLYVAWETLAAVLMDQNRLADAETAMNEAISRNKDDVRMQVSMARLQYLKGDFDRAREIIKVVRKNLDQLNAFERAEFEKLAANVARQR
jgi:tetratricopeptide (TPR) repeat protein/ABC-type cobalt transport system substrate-binding protein